MAIRCGCSDEGDDIVFGEIHQCRGSASTLRGELERLEREDPEVAEASAALDQVADHILGRLPSSMVAAIYDLERPYEQVLDADERGGH